MSTANVGTTVTSTAERKIPFLSVAGWVLYDLANTIFSLNIVSLYFSLWVVNVMGAGDADYGYATSISMAVIFIASPLLGALSDQAPRRMPFLVISTLICVGFTLLLGQGSLVSSLIYFSIANIAYQAGLQFYDALLPEVSTEENRGWIGGIGVGIGYFGSVIGIAVGSLILAGADQLPPAAQSAPYITVFRVTAVLFLLFALPCFFFVHERSKPGRHFSLASIGAATRQIGGTLRSTGKYPGLVRFLVGRIFYTDAVNTVIAFMGIYVTNEVGFSTSQAQLVLLVAILFAVVGGFAWGKVVDRIGPKRSLDLVLFMWIAIFIWAAVVGFLKLPGLFFWPVPCLAGIALGGTWTADRPYMLRLTPPARVGEFYGLYGMVGRFAAITGPFIWALVSDTLGLGRPAAILSLLVGIVVSYFILRPVSDERREWSPEERGEVAA
ncbi:MAG TPA: MFS transporter [Roseiflexaceae bacterium]|nr:MFS transporter [Roseiflexaceae bacterium]